MGEVYLRQAADDLSARVDAIGERVWPRSSRQAGARSIGIHESVVADEPRAARRRPHDVASQIDPRRRRVGRKVEASDGPPAVKETAAVSRYETLGPDDLPHFV